MKLKKMASILCVMVIVLSLGTTTALAGVGDTIAINNDVPSFNELVVVENGKVYLPLRLALPNFNDKINKRGLKLDWEEDTIRLIYGETDGSDYIKNPDGTTMLPFVGTRKCIDIFLDGDANNGAKAYLTEISYELDEKGERVPLAHFEHELSDLVYLKAVEGGDRIFISINDVTKLFDLLGIDNSYKVWLYE